MYLVRKRPKNLSFRVVASIPNDLDLLAGDKATESHVEEDTQFQELVHPHLPLPVEDIPKPLAIYSDATTELCDTDSSIFTHLLYLLNDTAPEQTLLVA